MRCLPFAVPCAGVSYGLVENHTRHPSCRLVSPAPDAVLESHLLPGTHLLPPGAMSTCPCTGLDRECVQRDRQLPRRDTREPRDNQPRPHRRRVPEIQDLTRLDHCTRTVRPVQGTQLAHPSPASGQPLGISQVYIFDLRVEDTGGPIGQHCHSTCLALIFIHCR